MTDRRIVKGRCTECGAFARTDGTHPRITVKA